MGTQAARLETEARPTSCLPSLAAFEPLATAGQVKLFLLKLGTMTAGNLSATDIAVKVAVFLEAMPDIPAAVLAPASLRRAGERWKFFPSFLEWSEFVANEKAMLNRGRITMTDNPLMDLLRGKLTAAAVNAWIKPLVVEVRGDRAAIRCPNEMTRAWCRTNYEPYIMAVLRVADVSFLLGDEPEPDDGWRRLHRPRDTMEQVPSP